MNPEGFDLLRWRWLGAVCQTAAKKKVQTDGKRLRNLCAALCDDVAAHPPHELPLAGPARDRGIGSRLLRLAGSGRRPRYPGRYRLQRRGGGLAEPQAHAQSGGSAGALRRGRRRDQGRRRDPSALRPRRQSRPVSERAVSSAGPRDELRHRALHVLRRPAPSIFGGACHADGPPRLLRARHLSFRRRRGRARRHPAPRRRPFRRAASGAGRNRARAGSAGVGCRALLWQSASPQSVSDRLQHRRHVPGLGDRRAARRSSRPHHPRPRSFGGRDLSARQRSRSMPSPCTRRRHVPSRNRFAR